MVILPAAAAASLAGVKPVTLRIWAHRGVITKIGRNRYDMGQILNWIDRHAEDVEIVAQQVSPM